MHTTITIIDAVSSETAQMIRDAHAWADHADRTPIAWKHDDPTDGGARFVYDAADLAGIEREDPDLIVRVRTDESTSGGTFAIIDDHHTIVMLATLPSDEDAQRWFARMAPRAAWHTQPLSLVVLDLGDDETPRVGDVLTAVCSDGIGSL